MSSPVFDQPHLADIGAEYERFVGAYFEIIHGCFVIYHGRMLGEEDGGIDLIAVNQSKTYLVQCKNRYRSLIHENTVNQLGGAARSFAQKYPEARNITPIVFTTTDFDAQAQFAAEANNVQLRRMSYERKTVDDQTVLFNEYLSTEGHHSPTYDLPMPADYSHFVSEALSLCIPSPVGRHAAPEPEQTVQKPNHTSPEPEQRVQINPVYDEYSKRNQASSSSPSVDDRPIFRDSNTPPDVSPIIPRFSAREWFLQNHPLKFHNLLRFVLVPMYVFLLCQTASKLVSPFSSFVVAISIVIPIMLCIAFVLGSFKFAKFSYYAILSQCWLNFAILAISSISGVTFIPAVISLIWAKCVTDYYKKRKPLFFPELLPSPPPATVLSHSPRKGLNSTIKSVLLYLCILGIPIGIMVVASYNQGTLPEFPNIFYTAAPTPNPTPAVTSAPLPANGNKYAHAWSAITTMNEQSELTIETKSSDQYYCIILVDADKPEKKLCSLFAYPGKTVTFDVPAQNCLVYYTYGPADSWYGYNDYFGSEGRWVMSDEVFDFENYTYDLTLYKVTNGNWDTDYIDRSQVPFLN